MRGSTRRRRAIAGRRRRSSAGSASRPGQGRCRCTTASGSASRCSSRRRTTSSWRPAVAAGSAASSRGRAGSTRRVSSSRRQPTAYEELGARLDAVSTTTFGRADVELLAGDEAAAEAALRDGYEALGNLGEIGNRLRSRRCSPARCTRAVTPRRRTSSPARSRRPRPSRTSGRRRSTGSPAHGSSPSRRVRRGGARRAAMRSRSWSPPTCSICGADVLLELAVVLRSAGRAARRAMHRDGHRALRGEGERCRRRARPGTLELAATTA